MNHYDGPAFYRKFVHEATVNKNNKVNAMRERRLKYTHGKQNVTGFSRDVQRANFNNFKPFKTSSSHIDLQNNPIAKITADFKPRRHYGTPDQGVHKSSAAPNEFQRISTHYHQLTSELSPSNSEITLLAETNPNQDSNKHFQRTGALHFRLASKSTNNEFARNDNGRLENGSQSNYSENPFSNIENSSLNSGVPLTNSQSSAPSSGSENKSLRTGRDDSDSSLNPSSNYSVESSEKASASVESKSSEKVSESINNSRQDSLSSSSSDNFEPLGHNISSIMHDEGQDVKNNLELFKRSESKDNSQGAANETQPDKSSSSNDRDLPSDKTGNLNASSNNESSSKLNSSNDEKGLNGDHSNEVPFGKRPNFVAQNPTNVQPSNDFSESNPDDEEKHHEIQPSTVSDYHFPSHDLLVAPKHYDDQGLDDWILNKAETLNKTLRAFHVNAQVVDWTNGPTVTQFQVKLHLGVKVSKINHLSDDLKMALAAKDIRIQAPIPGKTTCGIEIPNPKPRPVMLSEVVNSKTFRNSKSDLTIALGVDLTGKPRVTDLRKMPHGLIAGATGSGKSVFINCMLVSLMYKATPQELKMILIDPKAVEFAPYNGIPYLLSPVISEPKQAAASLKWATKEMNQRYDKLAAAGVRNIEQFNQKAEHHHQPEMKMPYILIVIDELADLMMVAGDEIETYIVRITQKARAAGIHLVVATQRPSVDVITGTMKNNIPTRVAFMVSSQVDSRTIIDQSGAERLLGKGDMLFLGNGSSHPIRLQGCFVSNQEIDRVAGFARHQEPAHYAFHPGSLLKHVSRLENQDKLMPQVLAYIAKEKTVSTSKLQRVFSIGYNRSAKIIDSLEQHGYISEQKGSKPRDVYLTEKDYKKLNL